MYYEKKVKYQDREFEIMIANATIINSSKYSKSFGGGNANYVTNEIWREITFNITFYNEKIAIDVKGEFKEFLIGEEGYLLFANNKIIGFHFSSTKQTIYFESNIAHYSGISFAFGCVSGIFFGAALSIIFALLGGLIYDYFKFDLIPIAVFSLPFIIFFIHKIYRTNSKANEINKDLKSKFSWLISDVKKNLYERIFAKVNKPQLLESILICSEIIQKEIKKEKNNSEIFGIDTIKFEGYNILNPYETVFGKETEVIESSYLYKKKWWYNYLSTNSAKYYNSLLKKEDYEILSNFLKLSQNEEKKLAEYNHAIEEYYKLID